MYCRSAAWRNKRIILVKDIHSHSLVKDTPVYTLCVFISVYFALYVPPFHGERKINLNIF